MGPRDTVTFSSSESVLPKVVTGLGIATGAIGVGMMMFGGHELASAGVLAIGVGGIGSFLGLSLMDGDLLSVGDDSGGFSVGLKSGSTTFNSNGTIGFDMGNGISVNTDGSVGFDVGGGMTVNSNGTVGFSFG